MPSSRSVVNRLVAVPLFDSDKKGTEESMREIRSACFLKDLLTKALNVTEEQKAEAFLEAERRLEQYMSGRQLMLYSFLLAANILFDIFDDQDLLEAVLENAQSLGEVDCDEDELSTLLADLLVTRRITGVKLPDFS